MVCIFSVLLKRLTGGSSELYDVLGQLPGVNQEDLSRRYARRSGRDVAAAGAASRVGGARLRRAAAPDRRVVARRAGRAAAGDQARQAGRHPDDDQGLPGRPALLPRRDLLRRARRARRPSSASASSTRWARRRAAAVTEILDGTLPPDAMALAAVEAALLVHEPDHGALLQSRAGDQQRRRLRLGGDQRCRVSQRCAATIARRPVSA